MTNCQNQLLLKIVFKHLLQSVSSSQISQLQTSRNKQPILSCPGQRPRFHIWNFQWIPVSNHGGIMFIMSNQNIIIQRMSNQDLKDKQFLCNLFSWTTSQNYQVFQKDEQPLCYLFSWATSLVLIFIVSNQSTASQRMSNHYVYYSLWATTYFLSQVL